MRALIFLSLSLIFGMPLSGFSNNAESGFRLFANEQGIESLGEANADARVVFVVSTGGDSGMNKKGERRVSCKEVQSILPGGCIVPDKPFYMGIFVSGSETMNQLVDVDGFANWGYPGSVSNYDNVEFSGGVLVGKKFTLGRSNLLFRVEADSTFGDGLWAETSQLDPRRLDETARAEIEWLSTLRVGIERTFGAADVFVFGGLAAAEIINSVTDIDYYKHLDLSGDLNIVAEMDPDDSFYDSSVRTGWVIGVGAETKIGHKWLFRLDSSYVNLGEDTFYVNSSGNNRCGVGGDFRPCSYDIENELTTVRAVLVRQLRW